MSSEKCPQFRSIENKQASILGHRTKLLQYIHKSILIKSHIHRKVENTQAFLNTLARYLTIWLNYIISPEST